MVLTVRLLKKMDPNCRIAFIGPCAAKKLEASRRSVRSDVDFVLTFEELRGMFEAKGIDFSQIEDRAAHYEASAPGVGFAMGMERVIELMRECGRVPVRTQTDVYVIHSGGDTQVQAMLLAEALRDAGVRVMVHPGKSGFKSQMKKADARGARFAVIAAPPRAERTGSIRKHGTSLRCGVAAARDLC